MEVAYSDEIGEDEEEGRNEPMLYEVDNNFEEGDDALNEEDMEE
jgi:hypothetical protein